MNEPFLSGSRRLAMPHRGLARHAGAQDRDRSMLRVSQFPLINDDGERMPNHAVTLPGPIERLPGVVAVGNPRARRR